MIVRRQLLRRGRLLSPSITTKTTIHESLISPVTRIQSRSLRVEHVELNLPSSAAGKTIEDLVQEGAINQNVASWLHRKKLNEEIGNYGAVATPTYQPYQLLANPPSVEDVTLELLLASQAHLGHSTALWHPGNARYIFGIREGIHVISLEATAAHLRRAAKIVEGVAKRAGVILFVGTRSGHERTVVRAAQLAGACHLFDKWTPGTLTNGERILARCEKKVVDQLDRKLTGFAAQLVQMGAMKPDLVICLNPVENYVLLQECAMNNIPTIGVIDTNANPTWVTYPIPANDDSKRCIEVIAGVLGRAGQTGRAQRLARAEKGEVPFTINHRLVMPKVFEEKENARANEGLSRDTSEQETQSYVHEEDMEELDEQDGNQVKFAHPPRNFGPVRTADAETEMKQVYADTQNQVEHNQRRAEELAAAKANSIN